MNARTIVVFLDFAMFLVLVAITQWSATSKAKDITIPEIIVVQKIYGGIVNVAGDNLRIDEEINIGISFELEGIRYTDLEQGEGVEVVKSKGGFVIKITNGDLPDKVAVFARDIGSKLASCLTQSGCPKIELPFSCRSATSPGVDFKYINQENEFFSECVSGS